MIKIPLTDILMCFSDAIDMVSLQMSDHNKRVAYIANAISSEMGLSDKERSQILIAGLLHDCGAIREDEKIRTLQYDFGESPDERYEHAVRGWNLLRNMDELSHVAEIIRYHHTYWNERAGLIAKGHVIPGGSPIIHLADRVDILVNRCDEILGQIPEIERKIRSGSGEMYMPEAVEAFLRVSSREYFWFDIVSPYIEQSLKRYLKTVTATVRLDRIEQMAGILNKIVDYRSRFTATHSVGVAKTACSLSSKMHFPEEDIRMMNIAGLLHDIGKLAIPVKILEKDGSLSPYEYNIIKKHTFYSYRIFEKIPGMRRINEWMSYHHERLDGNGYPFGIAGGKLTPGARIMAVSDVFTALTEMRPYRPAMPVQNAKAIMNEMVKSGHLDGDVVAVLQQNVEEISRLKVNAQIKASIGFTGFMSPSYTAMS